MTEKKEAPPEAMASLIWLEAKQVLRGCPTGLLPDLTFKEAHAIRSMGYEAFKATYLKRLPTEVPDAD